MNISKLLILLLVYIVTGCKVMNEHDETRMLKKTDSIHFEIDKSYLFQIYKDYDQNSVYHDEIIANPLSYYFFEKNRINKKSHEKECHLFLWTVEKNINNSPVTKVGGIPYLPKSISWPISENGTSLNFVMQVNFMDSVELVNAKSDILLIFTKHSIETYKGYPEDFHYIWVDYDEKEEIISAIPDDAKICSKIQYNGVLCRTKESSDLKISGSKIGGYSYEHNLFTFSLINPGLDCPYPFVNHKDLINLDDYIKFQFSFDISSNLTFEIHKGKIHCAP